MNQDLDYSWMSDRNLQAIVNAIDFAPPKTTGEIRDFKSATVAMSAQVCGDWREQLDRFCKEFADQQKLSEYRDIVTSRVEDTELLYALKKRLRNLGYTTTLEAVRGGSYTR